MVLPSPPRIQCRRVLKVPQAPIATCMVVSATWISLVLIPVRRGNVDEIAQMWKPWRPSTHKMTLNHRAKTKTQKRNPVKTLTKVEKHFNYCILLQTFYLRRYFFVPLLILNAQLLQVGFNFVYIKYLQCTKKHINWKKKADFCSTRVSTKIFFVGRGIQNRCSSLRLHRCKMRLFKWFSNSVQPQN